jgi:hypothetical protein
MTHTGIQDPGPEAKAIASKRVLIEHNVNGIHGHGGSFIYIR